MIVEEVFKEIVSAPLERVVQEYELLKDWLPPNLSAVLDIGCGIKPSIDLCIARHYSYPITIHLLDGDTNRFSSGKDYTGYKLRTKPWRDRFQGVTWLRERLYYHSIYSHPPSDAQTIPCDLIVSRRSWGHHYPVETYIGLAKRSLRAGGRIIVDLRYGQGGRETFKEHGFKVVSGNLEISSKKCERVVLEREMEYESRIAA